MNRLKHLAVRIVGHDTTLGAHLQPSDLSEVTKLAPALLLGTVVATANAGVAGWHFSAGLPESARLVMTVLLALFGGAVVMAIDRGTVYYADTSIDGGRARMAFVVVLRVLLVLIISTFTSQSALPLLLGPELKAHALVMREQRERERETELVTRSGIPALADERQRLGARIAELEARLERLPAPVQQRLDAARRCWAEYGAARARAGDAADDAGARARLAAKGAACRAQAQAADSERDRHLDTTRRALADARDEDGRARDALADKRQAVDTRVQEAGRLEAGALDERSSTVLRSLLDTDAGARAKWLLLSALLMSIELLPFALKLMAGQSSLGRVAAHRKLRLDDELRIERQRRIDEAATAVQLRLVTLRAAEHLAQSPEAWGQLRREYAALLAARAPLETVNAFLRQLDEEVERLEASLHRHPQYASKIAAAWSDAVDRAMAAMRGSAAAA